MQRPVKPSVDEQGWRTKKKEPDKTNLEHSGNRKLGLCMCIKAFIRLYCHCMKVLKYHCLKICECLKKSFVYRKNSPKNKWLTAL